MQIKEKWSFSFITVKPTLHQNFKIIDQKYRVLVAYKKISVAHTRDIMCSAQTDPWKTSIENAYSKVNTAVVLFSLTITTQDRHSIPHSTFKFFFISVIMEV